MQCRVPRKKTTGGDKVTVELSGTFKSPYAYVTIGGTKYTSAQTLVVKKGTEVTVATYGFSSYSGAAMIIFNDNIIGNSTSYTLTVTDNCQIEGTVNTASSYGTIAITMPA